jgi:hypothetical protein
MASCSFTLAASVLSAREIGYWTTSELFDQALSPDGIFALFRSSLSLNHPSRCGFQHPLWLDSEKSRSLKGLKRRA